MAKQVLFIQGAGEGAYKEDELLVQSLRSELGPDYEVRYPEMVDEDDPQYDQWRQQIKEEIAALSEPAILVGHSLGGLYLAKALTEVEIDKVITGIFLLEAPFWGGKGWRYDGYQRLMLPEDAAAKLPQNAKVFLYQAHDDEIVSFKHLALYSNILPQAITREIDQGGHQLNNDLSLVAKDIRGL